MAVQSVRGPHLVPQITIALVDPTERDGVNGFLKIVNERYHYISTRASIDHQR